MRQGATAGTASAVAALLFLCSAADATQPTLREVERRRASAESEKRRLDTDSRAAARAVDDLNRKLVTASVQRRTAEANVAALEAQVSALMENERSAAADAARSSAAFERTLIALAQAEKADARPPHAAAVAAVAGRSLAQRAALAGRRVEQVRAERHDLAERRAALAVAQAQLDSKTAEIRTLLAEQQARQAVLNADASRANARLTQLAQQARSLRDLVARTAARRPAQTTRASASPASLRRLTPVAGTVVRRFGDRLSAGTAQGLTLRTRAGEQVLAPAAGRVAYSGPFRSYGIVLILDLDNDYAVVLTGMDAVLANVGQRVLAGQPIAEMADDATPAPELYVEVRRNGSPVDPARWLSAAR